MRKQPYLGTIQRRPYGRRAKVGHKWVMLLLAAVFAAGIAAYLYGRDAGDTMDNAARERFLAAVYVLQSLGGPAAEEAVLVPRRIVLADDTESLLHHSDRFFVLRTLADEFARLGGSEEQFPEAPLFEAYSRLALGERRAAADLLTSYVVEQPYQARHYQLLCETLQELEDYSSLLMICKEWQGREQRCLPQRLRFLWHAFFGLGRLAEARDTVLHGDDCLATERFVYAARACQAMGQKEEAEALMRRALEGDRSNGDKMLRLWGRLLQQDTPR